MQKRMPPHGDYDYMGETINFVENYKVEKVIFNCREYNELEINLIKVLYKKKVKIYYYPNRTKSYPKVNNNLNKCEIFF